MDPQIARSIGFNARIDHLLYSKRNTWMPTFLVQQDSIHAKVMCYNIVNATNKSPNCPFNRIQCLQKSSVIQQTLNMEPKLYVQQDLIPAKITYYIVDATHGTQIIRSIGFNTRKNQVLYSRRYTWSPNVRSIGFKNMARSHHKMIVPCQTSVRYY